MPTELDRYALLSSPPYLNRLQNLTTRTNWKRIRILLGCVVCISVFTLFSFNNTPSTRESNYKGFDSNANSVGNMEIRSGPPSSSGKSVVYVVTPTYTRLTQMADMTRLCQTLMLVPNVYWVVVEDSNRLSDSVMDLLQRSGMNYTHLHVHKPARYNLKPGDSYNKFPRGVTQRNLALHWIQQKADDDGIVYFADDDNSYDIRLFEEIRKIRRVGVFPVAFVGGDRYASPKVKKGRVVGWLNRYRPERKYAVDMAMFAVKVSHLKIVRPLFTYKGVKGSLEDNFMTSLKLEVHELEPLANNCTKILVWHTRTSNPETNFINPKASERKLPV